MQVLKTIDSKTIDNAINSLTSEISKAHKATKGLVVAGIANGGISLGKVIAQKLSQELNQEIPFGCVNSAFHRDDIDLNPLSKVYLPTNTPWDTHDATIILVDDVLCSGRTVRAALAEIFNLGRPAGVELAVLIDRSHYCLPIRPNYVGLKENTQLSDKVKVTFDENNPKNNIIEIFST